MLLAFGDRSFLRMLSEPVEPNKASYFVELNASFVHFIILQTITIFLALIGKAYVSSSASPLQLAFAALSYMLFLYSLSAALAATMAIFRVATLYAEVAALSKKSDRDCRGLRGPDQDS
jgi:hypothetical protein